MSPLAKLLRPFVAFADRFVPSGLSDPHQIHRTRASLFQTWLGAAFTGVFGAVYAWAGSPWSGAAILALSAGLLATPFAIRRGIELLWIGTGLVGVTWLATFIVASRSGGFGSPAIAWAFLFPLATYAACSPRSAVIWAGLSCLQIAFFWGAELLGVRFAQDFTPFVLSLLRISGYVGVVLTTVLVLSVIESTRNDAFEALDADHRRSERARILDDMHDGVGSQLLGLIVQLRAGPIDSARLTSALESALDDLRLIVRSREAEDLDFEVALGELRARLVHRFEAGGIELHWETRTATRTVDGGTTLQVLRALQEITTNTIRHARAPRVDVLVCITDRDVELSVRDYGIGIDLGRPTTGRGLKSLEARARKAGGRFEVERVSPGTLTRLTFPLEPQSAAR